MRIFLLGGKVEEESEAVIVSPERFLALPLLVFPLKKLKLGEPLKHRVSDFRPTGFVCVLNDGDVCIESFKVCVLALLSVDCRIEVIANGLPTDGYRRRANTAGNRDQ